MHVAWRRDVSSSYCFVRFVEVMFAKAHRQAYSSAPESQKADPAKWLGEPVKMKLPKEDENW